MEDGSLSCHEETRWVFSFDDHNKFMGFQNSTFPIAIYGCLDTASRKLVSIKVLDSNSSPYLIARLYFYYLYELELLSHNVRLEKGTETGVLTTMHAYLRRQQYNIDTDEKACDTVTYGPSTSNQTNIRRFYISFKQTLKQKTLHNLFFC